MYLNLKLRLCETILNINDTLTGMALDPRLIPGVAAEMRSIRSSASTPSLRSREGSVTPIGRMDEPGGNVRVVVRVRGFLPRGISSWIGFPRGWLITSCRNSTRRGMFDFHEPDHPNDESPCTNRYGSSSYAFKKS